MKKSKSKTKHVGSDFAEFLREEGIADEVEGVAIERVLAWQMQQAPQASPEPNNGREIRSARRAP